MSTNSHIRTFGAPVRSVNWVRVFPTRDADGNDCLVAVMGQQAENLFVLKIDPVTGVCKQFNAQVDESNYPTAAMRSRDGTIYIGAAHSGHLFAFDPASDVLEDLGAINLPDDIFPCQIDEDESGKLWIGCYGSAGLTSYDPPSRTFMHHGRMDDTDMYCYPLVAPDGTVACDIKVTVPHVAVYDPSTGRRETVGPVISKEDGGRCSLLRAIDGFLYMDTSEGHFRLDGFEAVPVDELPEVISALTLSDGTSPVFTDAAVQRYQTIGLVTQDGETVRELNLNYAAAGSSLFLLHDGPDNKLYGSSILPLHLFEFEPYSGNMEDLGQCSTSTGEVYSMGNLDGKLYMCSYPGAKLSVYDPAMPYQFGTEAGSNPRDLGRMDEVSYRPRSMVTGPLGRIWTAAVPDYGIWGGPLSWYEPATGTFGTYRDIAGDASCWSLAWLEDRELMAVGTTIQGGSGTQPRVSQASLFLWDYVHERKTWEGTPDRSVTSINALVSGSDGLLYGTYSGLDDATGLFRFNPETTAFEAYTALPAGQPLEGGLRSGPDGVIYGFTRSSLYRLDPESLEITVICQAEDTFHVPGPIREGNAYFTKVHEICSVSLD
ncbi:MAG: hypothetical protein HOH43_08605 [Candidatus Latescibacteria bacterium]|nr:hypothetical protein [Candidatus Latescibacterota bacterium]